MKLFIGINGSSIYDFTKENGMENFSGLIAVLLEHSQRFIDFWNLQLVIALGVLGFSLANPQVVSKTRIRLLISFVFIAIAAFSVFSLSAHQVRAENLWAALEARIAATPREFIPEEVAYIDSLKPTAFPIKAGAIIAADALVILVIWFSPKIKD
jgi:uncharacterized membrane protein